MIFIALYNSSQLFGEIIFSIILLIYYYDCKPSTIAAIPYTSTKITLSPFIILN